MRTYSHSARLEPCALLVMNGSANTSSDVKRAAREPVVDLALVAKATNESLDERRSELGLELEALDGNGLVESDVLASVDDAEPALADDPIDPELSVENLPHQAVDVLRSHGRTIHRLAGWETHPLWGDGPFVR